MTKLYIDTEFNDFNGPLISMALVAESGEEFYEVLECSDPSDWVAENVMPILAKDPVPREVLQYRLQRFLCKFDTLEIIADWPEDLKHFCEILIQGAGICLYCPPFTLSYREDLSSIDSKVPHNALHDARAIADEDLSRAYDKGSV